MTFGITGNLEKPGLREAVARLVKEIEKHRLEYVLDRKIAELVPDGTSARQCGSLDDCARRTDMLVAFGGDGTILSAARAVGAAGTPILGINLGKLGFLAELAPEEVEKAVADIVAKKYDVQERLVLEARSPNVANKVFCAVNDIVIDKSRSSRIIDLETYIDGAFAVTYRADGLIVATPTGSTAYALSNGGPIVTPTSSVFGITPISPHTLSGRPLIVPETSVVRIRVSGNSDEVLISADGQTEAFLKPPVEVEIKKAGYTLKLVKRRDRSYFDVLRAKLLWGKDPRSS